MYALGIGLLLLIAYYIYEYCQHSQNRRKIPLVIHVNGTRGKSSVTRLIAAGLRAGGKKTMAKTTGSAPRIILEDGTEVPVIRNFGPNIKEQIKVFKYASLHGIDALVLECMAITPEYQWTTEQGMIRSDIGVITNIRLDHDDVMGPGIRNVAYSICNTIPYHAKAFTCEEKLFPLIQNIAAKRSSQVQLTASNTISEDYIRGFSYLEHKENIALALAVCEECGVEKDIALKGMKSVHPDIGATKIFLVSQENKHIYFANCFAANDPESTQLVIQYVRDMIEAVDFIGMVLNTRTDRMFRSRELITMLPKFDYDKLYLVGEQISFIKSYAKRQGINPEKICNLGWVTGEEFLTTITKCKEKKILLIGIGNIGGNGGIILRYFEEKGKEYV
ncbi:MAG: poly-gamma-glutamate synthase PgsB [Candidatus Cloacimonadia bacterium]